MPLSSARTTEIGTVFTVRKKALYFNDGSLYSTSTLFSLRFCAKVLTFFQRQNLISNNSFLTHHVKGQVCFTSELLLK